MAAEVKVRFSVENAEVVRQALAGLGKDGEKALKQFDAAGKPASKTLSVVGEAMSDLRGRAAAMASSLGPAGTLIAGLGAPGLVAAGAIGALAYAMNYAGEKVKELADKAGRLRDFSEQVELTVTQLQALEVAGGEVDVKAEKIGPALVRLAGALVEVRDGAGGAFEKLRGISPQLADQLARTRDLAGAINVLAKSWDSLNVGERAAVTRALGLRDTALGRLIGEIGKAGGLEALTKQLKESITLTSEQAKHFDDLRDKGEKLRTSAGNRFWGMIAENQLNAQLETAQALDWISRKLQEISKIQFSKSVLDFLDRIRSSGGLIGMAVRAIGRAAEPASGAQSFDESGFSFGPDAPLPRARPAAAGPGGELSAEHRANALRRRIALLGQAATAAEQLQLRELEVAAAIEKDKTATDDANRGLQAYKDSEKAAEVAIRERLGIASEEELLQVRMAEINRQYAEGFIKNEEEKALAVRLATRDIKAQAEQKAVQASDFQQLAKLSLDAGNLKAQLDSELSGALRGSTADLIAMAKGTETLGEGLKKLGERFLDAALQALFMKAVVGPLAGAFNTGLSGLFASGQGNVFNAGAPVPFAAGGIITRPSIFPMAQGYGLAGEKGWESIMPLRRDSKGNLGVIASGGGGDVQVVVNNYGSEPVKATSQRGPDGRQIVEVVVGEVFKRIGRGDGDGAMGRFGAAPVKPRR